MNWRTTIAGILVGLSLAPALPGNCQTATDPRPNILLLLSDDQRADTIRGLGNCYIDTANLDGLVRRGTSFRNAYCMGSMGGAVCVPSRAMLHCGRSLFRVEMNMAGAPTLGQLLGGAGYATFAVGKWHNGRDSFARSFQQGQAVFFGGMSDHTQVPIVDLQPDRTFSQPRSAAGYSSTVFADAAVEFLRQQDGRQPFFCYVAFSAPHDPRMPPAQFADRYDPEALPLPANFLPQHPFNTGAMEIRDEMLAPWPRTADVIRQQLAEYYAMITHLDQQVGRILAALREGNQEKNTIVIFASDHGLALGSHGLLGKQSVYEHSMKAPLIVAGPGIPARCQSTALVYLHDLFPTICQWAGVETPGQVDGTSLLPIIEGQRDSVRDSLFSSYGPYARAVRDDCWKLIRWPQIDKTQLFNLQADPDELCDLSDQPACRARVVEMLRMLSDWQADSGDLQPLVVDDPKPAEIDLTGRPRTPDEHQPEWVVQKYFDSSK